jgi:hypothetical protein
MMKQIVGTVAGVVSGYLVMMIVIFVAGAAVFPLFGMDASMTVVALRVVFGLAAGFAGGWATALVGGKTQAVPVLAGMVLVFGLITAASDLQSGTPLQGHDPVWVTFVGPLLGAVGVLIGGRRRMNF